MTASTEIVVSSEKSGANGSRPIKRRGRRSRAEMEKIRDAIYAAAEELHPVSARGVFYAVETAGFIAKTDAEYKGTVVRLLGEMRRSGELPFEWIADSTRWMRKPSSYTGLEQMLEESRRFYRQDLWHESDTYVEIWLEKDALAGVVYDVTETWDVPLMVTRGYPSLSFMFSAAMAIARQDRPTYLYYFGDFDPSGVDIPRVVRDRVREIAPDADFSLEIVAVTPEQIESMQLPSRPTKKTDSRSKGFGAESVELDAIPAPELRRMVSEVIEQQVDHGEIERLQRIEDGEREQLAQILANMGGGAR